MSKLKFIKEDKIDASVELSDRTKKVEYRNKKTLYVDNKDGSDKEVISEMEKDGYKHVKE